MPVCLNFTTGAPLTLLEPQRHKGNRPGMNMMRVSLGFLMVTNAQDIARTDLPGILRKSLQCGYMNMGDRYLRRKKAIAHFASQKRGPALSERGLQLLLLHNSSSCLQVYTMSAGDKIGCLVLCATPRYGSLHYIL